MKVGVKGVDYYVCGILCMRQKGLSSATYWYIKSQSEKKLRAKLDTLKSYHTLCYYPGEESVYLRPYRL